MAACEGAEIKECLERHRTRHRALVAKRNAAKPMGTRVALANKNLTKATKARFDAEQAVEDQ
eukprot:3862665-Lingulodinium_polyedra.AAC.1